MEKSNFKIGDYAYFYVIDDDEDGTTIYIEERKVIDVSELGHIKTSDGCKEHGEEWDYGDATPFKTREEAESASIAELISNVHRIIHKFEEEQNEE